MKIGEFANCFNVSKDAVRHYMELGLLIPDASGAQYRFTERELRDMRTIIRLKEKKFSLNEIREYLDIQRVSTSVELRSIQETKVLFRRKMSELEEQIGQLKEIYRDLEREIQGLRECEVKEPELTGVPLRLLPLLVCPVCKTSLRLKDAELDSRYIYCGTLCCKCGYHAKIDDGIVDTGNRYTGCYDVPDLNREIYRDISDDFVVYLQKCFDQGRMFLQRMEQKNKIILEGHINAYFFLYSNMQYLNPDCTYIITDKYPELLKMYKKRISQMHPEQEILYLADATMNWPLKPKCANVLIDFMGDNEHGLYFNNFYIQDVKPFLSESAVIVGAAQGYLKGAKSLELLAKQYPEGKLSGFTWDELDSQYLNVGYKRFLSQVGTMKKIAKKRAYKWHKDGEEMFIGGFYAVPTKLAGK